MILPADAYNHTDSELLESESSHTRDDAGSTASTAILVGDRLLVANVGDSRAVICRAGNGNVIVICSVTHLHDRPDHRLVNRWPVTPKFIGKIYIYIDSQIYIYNFFS